MTSHCLTREPVQVALLEYDFWREALADSLRIDFNAYDIEFYAVLKEGERIGYLMQYHGVDIASTVRGMLGKSCGKIVYQVCEHWYVAPDAAVKTRDQLSKEFS